MILDEIAESTRERLARQKRERSLASVRRAAEEACRGGGAGREKRFEDALRKRRRAGTGCPVSFICEVKKASPSKGVIAQDFPYLEIAAQYEAAGADAISVLTEPAYFQGSPEYLRRIAGQVSIPVLRKDFTVDDYQIYEARELGACAVLLICALLEPAQLRAYRELAESLGMSALVEAHTEAEIDAALQSGARIVGVNNRDLKTFTVDLDTSGRLRKYVPPEVAFVSESGIRGRDEIRRLEEIGADAALIGETFMRSPDKARQLALLRGEAADGD